MIDIVMVDWRHPIGANLTSEIRDRLNKKLPTTILRSCDSKDQIFLTGGNWKLYFYGYIFFYFKKKCK